MKSSRDVFEILRDKLRADPEREIVISIDEFQTRHGLSPKESERRYYEFVDSVFPVHNFVSPPIFTAVFDVDAGERGGFVIKTTRIYSRGDLVVRDDDFVLKISSLIIAGDTRFTASSSVILDVGGLIITGGDFSFNRSRGLRLLIVNNIIFNEHNKYSVFVVERVRVGQQMMKRPSYGISCEFRECVFDHIVYPQDEMKMTFINCVISFYSRFDVDAVFKGCEFHVEKILRVDGDGEFRSCRFVLGDGVGIVSVPEKSTIEFEHARVEGQCRTLSACFLKGDRLSLHHKFDTIFSDCSFDVLKFGNVGKVKTILHMDGPCRFLSKNRGLSGVVFHVGNRTHYVKHNGVAYMNFVAVTESCRIVFDVLKNRQHIIPVFSFLADDLNDFNMGAIPRLAEALNT